MSSVDNTNIASNQSFSVSQTGSEGPPDVALSKKDAVGIGSAAGSAATPTPVKNKTLCERTDAINYYLSPKFNESISHEALNKVVGILKQIIKDFDDILKTLSSDTDPVGINVLTNKESISDDFAAFPKRVKDLLSLLAEVANLERSEFIEMIKNRNNSIVSQLLDSAKKLISSADNMLSGAIASLACAVVATAITLGMSIKAAKPTSEGLKASKPNDALQARLARNQTKLDSPEISSGMKKSLTVKNREITAKMNANSERASGFHNQAQHARSSGEALSSLSKATGQFTETLYQSRSKRIEAEVQEVNALAQSEQVFRDAMIQSLNSLKSFVDALFNSYREIRDNQDQVKANLAKNT